MNRKIPEDAFEYYFSLGPSRSYELVARKYGASKRAVTSVASREQWQERIVSRLRQARERADTKAVETLEQTNDKHLKALQFVLGRALEALRSMPLQSAMDAVRAIEVVIRQERLVRGEATDRTDGIEALIKRQYALCMLPQGEDDWSTDVPLFVTAGEAEVRDGGRT